MKAIRALVPALWLHTALGARLELIEESLGGGGQEQKSNISICTAVSQETLETHRRCSASLQTPSVLRRFPNLEKEWCDLRLMDITEHRCESEEQDRLHHAALLETSFGRITALVGSSEEALTAEGAWESCSSRHRSCVECESRYAGAREHIATAHACEWRAGACVKSGRRRPRPWGEAASMCGRVPAAGSFLDTNSSQPEVRYLPKILALLVGFSYSGRLALPGAQLDVAAMFRLLTERKSMPREMIHVITDRPGDLEGVPPGNVVAGYDGTSTGFWEKVQELPIHTLGPGDQFLLYFSGRAAQTRTSQDSKELDGKDEWLATPNFDAIMDNDFYRFLLGFPRGAAVTVVTDASGSDGFSDLPFSYNPGSKGEHFEAQREWCTEWAHSTDELPRARVYFLSGGKNKQSSTLTNYAVKHWRLGASGVGKGTYALGKRMREGLFGKKEDWGRGGPDSLFHRLRDLHKHFAKNGHSQGPSFHMWPTMLDSRSWMFFSGDRDPVGTDAERSIAYYPFVGGPREGDCDMAVPPICGNAARPPRGFRIVEDFKYAGKPYTLGHQWEGWEVKELTLQLSPGSSGIVVDEDLQDVVRYIEKGSPGAHAGVRVGDIIRSLNGISFSGIDPMKGLSVGGTLKVIGARA